MTSKQIKLVQITAVESRLYGLTKEGKVYVLTSRTNCRPGQGLGGGDNLPCDVIFGWVPVEMYILTS